MKNRQNVHFFNYFIGTQFHSNTIRRTKIELEIGLNTTNDNLCIICVYMIHTV